MMMLKEWNKEWIEERLQNNPDSDDAWGSCPWCWPVRQHSVCKPHRDRTEAFTLAVVIHSTCTSWIHLFPLISRHEFPAHALTLLPSGLLCSATLNWSAHSWGFLAWGDVDFKNLLDIPLQGVGKGGENQTRVVEKDPSDVFSISKGVI